MSEVEVGKSAAGRPVTYADDAVAYLHARGNTKLQKFGDRRAIIDVIVNHGGRMTLAEIDSHFGVSMRDKVGALARIGWISIAPPEDVPVQGELF